MTKRIYHVEMYSNDDSGPINHLVSARSQAGAAAYVMRSYGSVKLANPYDIAHLCSQGYKIEEAHEAPQEVAE